VSLLAFSSFPLSYANPEAIKVQNNKGMLPLHFALYREASNEIIKMIFIANCEATKVQNIDGWLPLHCALYRAASPSVFKMLFEAYPEAITVQS
jgi:ankyrin repeat protein